MLTSFCLRKSFHFSTDKGGGQLKTLYDICPPPPNPYLFPMPLTNQVKCIGYAVFQSVVHINLGTLSSTIRDSLFRMQLTLWPGGWGASWHCFDQQHCSFCRECGLLFDNFLVLLKSILQRWFSTFNTSLLVQGISLHDVNVLSSERNKYDFRGPISTI